jgi:RNA polymerase sigma-70 factor (ECF subfamily)
MAHNKPSILDGGSPIENETSMESSVRQAIKELPVDGRQILSMKYIDQMSTREIAQALDIPVGTVKSRLHHARERLRRLLQRSER